MNDAQVTQLAGRVGEALRARGWLAASAESCTGGGVGEAITRVPGSSAWFDRGFITYSNASKRDVLGVREETLDREGAVSEATALEMLAGALARSEAHVAVAVTGIAGPEGGTPGKPVGLVCFASGRREGPPRAESIRFAGGRDAVRRQSVAHALRLLLAAASGGR